MTEYVVMPGAHYQDICNAIREKTGGTEPICSGQIPSKIKDLPDNDHYDAFWDSYQDNGKRTHYMHAFAGGGWNESTFYPKYPFFGQGYNLQYAFYNSDFAGDLAERLVSLGFGNVVYTTVNPVQIFRGMTKVTRLPELRGSIASLNYCFYENIAMETIDKIVLEHPTNLCTFDNAFTSCKNLKNIRFEGVIAKNIGFPQSSLLSAESVQSVIDCMTDLTGATTQTFTLHADVGAKLTPEQKATITSKNWTLVY